MDEIVELMANAVIKNNGSSREDITLGEWYALTGHLRAALSALHEAGYSVLPNEPTEEMMSAGVTANDVYATEIAPCSGFRANDCYRAMLAASPIKKG